MSDEDKTFSGPLVALKFDDVTLHTLYKLEHEVR